MIKAKPKYPMDLYGIIYIDNIQRAAVIFLITPTTFPFDSGSRVDNIRVFLYAESNIRRNYCLTIDGHGWGCTSPHINIKSVNLEVIIKLDELVRLQMVIYDKTVFEGDPWL